MSARVAVVGSINVDLVIRVARLPMPGETVIGGSFHKTHGGKGANQAVAAARLGASTVIVGAVGDDDFGREARETLAREGVDVSWVGTSELPTGVAQILVSQTGENVIAVASGANGDVTAEQVTGALQAVLTPGAVVLASLEVPIEAVAAAATMARKLGCRFILNPAPARELPSELLSSCDVLTPNEIEARALGLARPEVLRDLGILAVVITRGAAGADLLRPGSLVHSQDAFPVEVVDTTGAGDAFSATLAWALAGGSSLEDAVRLAAAGGALATRAVGARSSLGKREEVEALAAGRPLSCRSANPLESST
jgi:ribokinase